jgi:serine palmitoyltransferase
MLLNVAAPSVTVSAPGAAETVTWETLYGVLSSPHPFLKRISNLPGSAVIWRYIKSSHQNDPARTFLELLLVIFVVYTWLKSRTRGDKSNFVKLTEKVGGCMDELSG